MTDEPSTELERLRALEYGGTAHAYSQGEWACCPVCGFVAPAERASYWAFDNGERPRLGPGYDERLAALVDERAEGPDERPSGPRHAADCWLAAWIEELEGRRGLASAENPYREGACDDFDADAAVVRVPGLHFESGVLDVEAEGGASVTLRDPAICGSCEKRPREAFSIWCKECADQQRERGHFLMPCVCGALGGSTHARDCPDYHRLIAKRAYREGGRE